MIGGVVVIGDWLQIEAVTVAERILRQNGGCSRLR